MLYIILVIVAIIAIITIYNAKYNNPFKLIFLLGAKGSGKTTLLTRYMTEYHKKGYSVYTNVKSCNLPYVTYIDVADVGKYIASPKSMLALDEVGIIYDARRWKQFTDEQRDYYKYQRQYKNVVVMTSQVWDCDKKVRSLCDKFYLCKSHGPISIAREFAMKDPFHTSDDVEDAVRFVPFSFRITWIPEYSKYFSSYDPPVRPLLEESPLTVVPLDHVGKSNKKRGRKPRRTPGP
ncbi:MAG: hypothetical protein J6S49_09615 [Erysipelotrichaceae bacterium]|nr:hypothetical protein [Erysipelotrichaceae bacterium]